MPNPAYDETQNLPQNWRRRLEDAFYQRQPGQQADQNMLWTQEMQNQQDAQGGPRTQTLPGPAMVDQQGNPLPQVQQPAARALTGVNPLQAVAPGQTGPITDVMQPGVIPPADAGEVAPAPGMTPRRAARAREQYQPATIPGSPLDAGQGNFPPAPIAAAAAQRGFGRGTVIGSGPASGIIDLGGAGAGAGPAGPIGGPPQVRSALFGAAPAGDAASALTGGTDGGFGGGTVVSAGGGSPAMPRQVPIGSGINQRGTEVTTGPAAGLFRTGEAGVFTPNQADAFPSNRVPPGFENNPYYSNIPTWQNTPLAAGLPTFQDVLRGQAGPMGQIGPQERARAAEVFNQMLNSTSNARTQAGQLGVQQGELGLRGEQARGMVDPRTGQLIPGSIANASNAQRISNEQHDFAMNRENQIFNAMRQWENTHPGATQEEYNQVRDRMIEESRQGGGNVGGGPSPMPGAGVTTRPQAPVDNGSFATSRPGQPAAPSQTPPVGNAPPGLRTSSETNLNQSPAQGEAQRITAAKADTLKRFGNNPTGVSTVVNPAQAHEAITHFLQQNPITPDNIAYLNNVLAGPGGLVGQRAFDEWQRSQGSISGLTTEDNIRRAYQQAANALGANIGPRGWNPNANPLANAIRVGLPILGNIGMGRISQAGQGIGDLLTGLTGG